MITMYIFQKFKHKIRVFWFFFGVDMSFFLVVCDSYQGHAQIASYSHASNFRHNGFDYIGVSFSFPTATLHSSHER